MKIREIIVGTGIVVTSQIVLAEIPAGLFNLAGKDSGLCFQKTEAMGLVQQACYDESLLWSAQQDPDGSYRLATNIGEQQYCLNVPGTAGADVRLGDCRVTKPLYINPLRDGYKVIESGTGLCLNIAGNRLAAGAKLIQFDCTTGDNEKLDFMPAAKTAVGEWGDKFELGLVAIASAILPNGELLFWSGSTPISFHGDDITYTGTFNPKGEGDGLSHYVVKDTYEMFCPATVMDQDGSLLIMGGGGKQTKRDYVVSYDADANKWVRENDLVIPRWYNSAVILGDGSVFTVGGDGDGDPIHTNMEQLGEIWNPVTREFKLLTGTKDIGAQKSQYFQNIGNSDYGVARAQYYRKLAVMHDGSILEYAPYREFVRHTVDGEGSSILTNTGRLDGPKYIQGATNVQYSADKVLLMGGNEKFGIEDYADDKGEIDTLPSLYSVYEIDLKTGQSVRKENMHHARYYANSVVMPDGKVFTVGGSRDSHLFDTSEAVYTPEIYDPASDEWTEVAQHQEPRNYHSTAVLLPDGRIWVGGGGACGANCEFNYTTAEIYSPPYLFKGERPEVSLITTGPTGYDGETGYNQQFDFRSEQAISSVSLIRLSAVTHSSNTDQRRIELEMNALGNDFYRVTTPLSSNIAPPGYYMLFALNENGVPSEAKMVKLAN
ncbi:galactose oxidase-like domain-containing protein [Hahella ganghwensis]|uniref:galactose oxidase-like domain-containing protein n=1 Tax=Hahella ganghwensis TaxID=286420 RepID=UPI000373C49C|nr:galactose oxidase-like domain-containing protein [Hahella ganghwensis]